MGTISVSCLKFWELICSKWLNVTIIEGYGASIIVGAHECLQKNSQVVFDWIGFSA